jgi:hypothetical protein
MNHGFSSSLRDYLLNNVAIQDESLCTKNLESATLLKLKNSTLSVFVMDIAVSPDRALLGEIITKSEAKGIPSNYTVHEDLVQTIFFFPSKLFPSTLRLTSRG